MREKILGLVMDNWDKWGLGDRPKELDFLAANLATFNFLIFRKGEARPVLMVKVSKNPKLRAEFDNLRKVDAVLPGVVPKPYEFRTMGDYIVMVQSFITGKTLYHSKEYPDLNLMALAFKGLISFHDAVRTNDFTVDDKLLKTLVVDPVDRFAAHTNSTVVKEQCSRLLEESRKLLNRRFAGIPQHCDFCFSNVLFTDSKKVKIIDWEGFGRTNLPCYDLFCLANSVYCEFGSYEGFLAKSPVNAILREGIVDYCNAFGIDTKLIDLLYPTAMVTFFGQNYPARLKAAEIVMKLVEFYFENRREFAMCET